MQTHAATRSVLSDTSIQRARLRTAPGTIGASAAMVSLSSQINFIYCAAIFYAVDLHQLMQVPIAKVAIVDG